MTERCLIEEALPLKKETFPGVVDRGLSEVQVADNSVAHRHPS